MAGSMNWDRAARRDAVRDGGYDDEPRGRGAAWGSKPATQAQRRHIALLAAEVDMPPPKGNVTRNVAKRWIAKAKVQAALALKSIERASDA